MRDKILRAFKIKDIVFLAIISAVAMATSAVMPLVASLQTVIFGIAHVVVSLQISLFFAIGLMKIRKVGALFIMALLTGLFQLLMAPPMFFSNIIVSLIIEVLIVMIFKGYQDDKAIFTAVLLYNPLGLPFNLLYNYLFGRESMVLVLKKAPSLAVIMTFLVIALSSLGAYLGIKISRELKQSGVMKQ